METNNFKIEVVKVYPSTVGAWKLMVVVKNHGFCHGCYVLETLEKWFGSAEFFWSTGNNSTYVVCHK